MPQPLKDAGFTWPVDGQIMHPRYLYAFRINAVLAGNSAFPLDSDILYVEIPDERFEPTPSMLEPGIRCLLYGSRYQIGGEYLVGDDWVKPVMLQGEKDPLYGIYLMQRYQKKRGSGWIATLRCRTIPRRIAAVWKPLRKALAYPPRRQSAGMRLFKTVRKPWNRYLSLRPGIWSAWRLLTQTRCIYWKGGALMRMIRKRYASSARSWRSARACG